MKYLKTILQLQFLKTRLAYGAGSLWLSRNMNSFAWC